MGSHDLHLVLAEGSAERTFDIIFLDPGVRACALTFG